MKKVSQFFGGIVVALGSCLLVISAAAVSVLEGNFQPQALLLTATPQVVEAVEPAKPLILPATLTPLPMTQTPACIAPEGWIDYVIVPGDTLEVLAKEWGTTAELLYEKNCLLSSSLAAGYTLYHPPQVTPTVTLTPTIEPPPANTEKVDGPATATVQPCGPPRGWIIYIVQPGDNLYRISLAYGISVNQLKAANCLASDFIRAGQRLFVPNVPTRVPTFTQIPTEEPQPEATLAPTTEPSQPPTDIPTETTPGEAPTEAFNNL